METKRYDRFHEIWQIECYRDLSPFYITRRLMVRRLIFEYAMGQINILDVGCGIGDMVSIFDSNGETYVGIDISKRALEKASKRFRSASFLLASANALPIRGERFDAAISIEVLEHLERDAEAVGEVSRILRDGGFAVFTVPQNPRYWTDEDTFDGHLRRYEAADFVRMLHSRHLKVEKLLSWGFPVAFLFRKYVSARLFNARLHVSLGMRKGSTVRIMAKVLAHVFRFDSLFNGLNLGLEIAAVARKTTSR